MKKQLTKGIALCLLAISVWNCKTNDPELTPYESGAFIINSGNFLDNNGSISFLPKNAKTASTDIFNTVNARTLTGGLQDYTEIDGKGVILVDNSTAGQDKIEIVESGTFKSLATFQAPDVENPRYVVKAGLNKAYISCWAATGSSPFYVNPGYVLVIDLASRTVKKKITVGKGAEKIVVIGNEAFVGSVGGDRVLTVINTDTDEIKQPSVEVGVNPNPIAVDANNRLWAYASSTKEVVQIDPSNKSVIKRLVVGNSAKSPGSFAISADKKTFFFVNSFYDAADNYKEKGEAYQFSIDASSIPATTPFIGRLFSGLGVDPETGTIYAGVTPSYKQAGYVLRYKPGTTTATLIDSVRAEIAPSKFYFR
ncbi:YncE family protein [Spirosoma sp.]|uniref:YncE family protein n=1 Tax=Spirosoma sp. TaxID=1899569 RepID=UPI003B3B2614